MFQFSNLQSTSHNVGTWFARHTPQVIPAATKAQVRDQLTTLSKRVVEAAKAAAAANKERAVAEAVAAADEAVAAGG